MKKDDPQYVVKLERAIEKKYGSQAIQNPIWNNLSSFIKKQNKMRKNLKKNLEMDSWCLKGFYLTTLIDPAPLAENIL